MRNCPRSPQLTVLIKLSALAPDTDMADERDGEWLHLRSIVRSKGSETKMRGIMGACDVIARAICGEGKAFEVSRLTGRGTAQVSSV